MYIFRSKLIALPVLILMIIGLLLPSQGFAQTKSSSKSGVEVFMKWATIGAMVVGAAVGVASFGVAGLFIGPLIGAAAATIATIFFQGNPVDQWRAVANKPPAYGNRNIFGMTQKIASNCNNNSHGDVNASGDVIETEAAYRNAYEAYQEAVKAGDQTNIAEKAASLSQAKSAYKAALDN